MIPLSRKSLESKLRLQRFLAYHESELSLAHFLGHWVINSSPRPQLFGRAKQPWQDQIWANMDQAVGALIEGKVRPGPRAFWRTLPRGHDKTSSIARRLIWLLAYDRKRPLTLITAAADQEQAGLITDSMRIELSLNPWLSHVLKITQKRAYGPGGMLKVLSSDSPTSWGLNADLYILDELTWWENDHLWGPLITAIEKRPGSVLIIITNAGIKGSWQEQVRDHARTDNNWDVWEAEPGAHLATWMTEDRVQALKKYVDPATARRVFDNIWIDPAEVFGFLSRSEVEACEIVGRELNLLPVSKGIYGHNYVAAVDYGPKRDRTALVVLHFDSSSRVIIDELTVLQGSSEQPVRIQEVENWIDRVNDRFYRPVLICDQYEMEGTIQKYEYSQAVVRFQPRGGQANYEMARCLQSLIANRQLAWYPGAGDLILPSGKVETLVDEIMGLVFRPTPYGYRFDHKTGFHDDRSVAIGMACLEAVRRGPRPDWVEPTKYSGPSVNRSVVPNIMPDRFGEPRVLFGSC